MTARWNADWWCWGLHESLQFVLCLFFFMLQVRNSALRIAVQFFFLMNLCWTRGTFVYPADVTTPSFFKASCNYGPGSDCLFPCHCAGNCDSMRGCTDVGDACESLRYQNIYDEDGKIFSGPQCQIGEFHTSALHNATNINAIDLVSCL